MVRDSNRIRFTYFAAEANYPIISQAEHAFYSTNELGQQVWNENKSDPLSQQYRGWVPQSKLIALLNERLNIGGKELDFRKIYKNWRFKFEQGYYYPGSYRYEKDSEGNRRKIIDRPAKTEVLKSSGDSRGNPPPNRENDAW